MNIEKILISQVQPTNQAPYDSLREKFGVTIDFKPFFLNEPLTSREFRAQRINILDYTAVVFSARQTIDAFFQLCEELRVKVPETMKYFCSTEAVAVYLQKHIVYRKRKIFFGTGTPESVVSQIVPKHKDEKILITTTGSSNSDVMTRLFEDAKLNFQTAVLVKSVYQDLKDIDIESYDMILFYNPSDVKSLLENYPDYKPGKTKFATYGKHIVNAMEEAGLPIEVKAPTAEAPSAARALELYLEAHS